MLNDLHLLRIKKNMSLKKLSILSGVGKTTINQIENGQSIPQIDTVCYIAGALEIEPQKLFMVLCEGEFIMSNKYIGIPETNNKKTQDEIEMAKKRTDEHIKKMAKILYKSIKNTNIPIDFLEKLLIDFSNDA